MENRSSLENYLKTSKQSRQNLIAIADKYLEQVLNEEKRKSRLSQYEIPPTTLSKALNLKPIASNSRTLRETNRISCNKY